MDVNSMAYKQCYHKLFSETVNTIIGLQRLMIKLQEKQLECEEILSSDDSPLELEENKE